jgi:release factor glutamine methyltransferase
VNWNIEGSLRWATGILAAAGVPEPSRDARTLLKNALGRESAFLYAHPEYVLRLDEQEKFTDGVERRAGREPLQYITGVQEFMGLEFEVSRDVLIPRPETQMLVERAIDVLPENDGRFCEIGTGSGCISVSILAAVHSASALAVDLSKPALAVAFRNACRHGVADRLEFRESDVFSNVPAQRFDIVVSNPPYVRASDLAGLQPEVADFEPRIALSDGSDGLSVISRIVEGSPEYLKEDGRLLLEIGFSQADAVREMFDDNKWSSIDIISDFQGIPRMVDARLG